MSELFGFDAYAPKEIARRVAEVGVVKARLPLASSAMLGVLAGAFIGLGALMFALVKSDATLGFAAGQLLGGLAFSLGLLLVVVAGAELFTGNNLLAIAWADGSIGSAELLRNWAVVALANAAGAFGLAVLVFLADTGALNRGELALQVLRIAAAKCQLPPATALFRGVLCNVLVCMAVWMAMAGRSVVDKAVAVVFPITAFVAAGFEHSIANLFFFPLAWFYLAGGLMVPGAEAVTPGAMAANLVPVVAGNLVGGSVLVGLSYHLIYRRGR